MTTARIAARHRHLLRAAQSAGEAFACPVPDERGAAPILARVGMPGLGWFAFGVAVLATLALVL